MSIGQPYRAGLKAAGANLKRAPEDPFVMVPKRLGFRASSGARLKLAYVNPKPTLHIILYHPYKFSPNRKGLQGAAVTAAATFDAQCGCEERCEWEGEDDAGMHDAEMTGYGRSEMLMLIRLYSWS